MRKLVLIAMVLMICLSTAIWAQENDSAVSRGMAHMAKQQYAEAILEFQEAKKLFPDVIDLDFMIGFAANNIGDYPLAIVSFQRVVSEMPSSRAKLELARAYMGESVEHFPSAKSLFQEVLEDNPSPELANAIHDLMSRMEIAGRMPPSGIAPPGVRSGHSFNGRLSSGISIDSNPYSNPGNYLISSIIGNLQFEPAGEGKWDVANISQINLAHAYRFNNTRLAWKTDGLLYGSFYADSNDLNMMYTQLRTGLAYEGERFGVEALGRFVHMEQDNRAELQSWGGEINTHFFINENFALFSGWRHDVKQRIRTTFRSGTSDGLFLGTMFQLNDRHRINIFSGMELERLHLDEESFNQPWIALRYSVLLPHKWEPYISYRFAHSKYKEKEWLFDAKRSDRKHDFGVGVKKTFWESRDRRRSLDAEASYRYTRNYSNMDLYDYKRHAIDFSVGFSF